MQLRRLPFLRSCLTVYLLVVVGGLLPGSSVMAQSEPAPLRPCLKDGLLTWLLPNGACGEVINATVFGASGPTGPFEELGTTGDAIPSFELPATTTATYFQVVLTYNCPGGERDSAPSEVLNTSQLLTSTIRSIDYTRSGTIITWAPSEDPRVTGYQIYRDNATGTVLLDEVDGLTYTEQFTEVERSGAVYYLGVTDRCESSSFNTEQYSSVTVDAVRDACNNRLTLTRNMPAPWPRPLVRSIVERTSSSGVVWRDTFAHADPTLTLPDLPPSEAYTVRVRYEDATGAYTRSFPTDVGSSSAVRSDSIQILSLSYENNAWRLIMRYNEEAGYQQAHWVLRRDGREVERRAIDSTTLEQPVIEVELPLDSTFAWTNTELYVEATDACAITRRSAAVRPLVLSSQLVKEETAVQLDWTAIQAPAQEVGTYEIRFLADGGSSPVVTARDAGQYLHPVTTITQRLLCYRTATEVQTAAYGNKPTVTKIWRTPATCVRRGPRVFIPSGFIPGGFTVGFRPQMSLTEGFDYTFSIYDRMGGLLFTTDNPAVTWEGRIDNRAVPGGVYRALVTLRSQETQEEVVFEKLFALIR